MSIERRLKQVRRVLAPVDSSARVTMYKMRLDGYCYAWNEATQSYSGKGYTVDEVRQLKGYFILDDILDDMNEQDSLQGV